MATNNPRGFVAAKALHGGGRSVTQRYKVSADNATALFPGDLVALNAQGGVESWITADNSALATADPVLGVVKAVYDTNGKPLTHSQPTKGPFLDASTGGYVEVYTDPDQIYIANASATCIQAYIGTFAPVSFGASNSAAGRSGWGVDLGSTVGSAVGNTPLRVIGIAEFDAFPDLTNGQAANNDVYVQIADHAFRRQFNRIGSDS